jgi:hypothetical protein
MQCDSRPAASTAHRHCKYSQSCSTTCIGVNSLCSELGAQNVTEGGLRQPQAFAFEAPTLGRIIMESIWVNFENIPAAVALDNSLKARRAKLESSSQSGQVAGLWVVTAAQLVEYIEDVQVIILQELQSAIDSVKTDFWGVLIQIDCTHLKVMGDIRTEIGIEGLGSIRMQYALKFSEFVNHVYMQFSVADSGYVSLNVSGSKFDTLRVDGALRSVYADDAKIRRHLMINGMYDQVTFSNSMIEEAHLGGASIADVRLISTSVMGSFSAEDCCFGELDFGLSTVKKRLVFDRCRFMHPPNMHATSLPSDTIFRKNVFLDSELVERFKPVLTITRRSDSLLYTSAADRFRALRLAMKAAGSQDEELRFFALEMRTRRQGGHMAGIERVVSWLYDVVSAYGSSVTRAMVVFFAWNLAFYALFFVTITFGPLLHSLSIPTGFGTTLGVPSTNPPTVDNTIAAFKGNEVLALTLQNALNPFAALSGSPAVRVNNLSLAMLSIIQSIGSVAAGALALLALRLKFQRSGG